jgi:hypothetical protein
VRVRILLAQSGDGLPQVRFFLAATGAEATPAALQVQRELHLADLPGPGPHLVRRTCSA